MVKVFTPYSTSKPFWSAKPVSWMSDDDGERVNSYQLYEEMYWGESITGIEIEDGDPIRVPSAKVIIEAIHQFLAVGWSYNITGENSDVCEDAFKRLFKREQVKSKVSSQKRYGLIRGDAMIHIVADPNKSDGSKISIYELDPASYFPIYDLDDPDKITGCHIVDQFTMDDDKIVIRRQTYRKLVDDNGIPTGTITSELSLFDLEAWDDRFGAEDIKLLKVIEPEYELPAPISAIPVYHWKNMRNPGDFFGSSVIRGIEKLLKSIDQTITDQDVALALASLGVYETDSAPPLTDPTDPTSEAEGWIIGPARVIEIQKGSHFNRVAGITSITPSIEHATYLENRARAGAGVPAVATGDVDVASAESGIALALKLMPLLAANAERELEMVSVLDHFLYDLQTMWFPAYEALSFDDSIIVESIVTDPMPVNRDAVIAETTTLLTDGLITTLMAIERLAELGWSYTKADIDALVDAAEQKAAAAADPFGDRLAREKPAGDEPDAEPDADE